MLESKRAYQKQLKNIVCRSVEHLVDYYHISCSAVSLILEGRDNLHECMYRQYERRPMFTTGV